MVDRSMHVLYYIKIIISTKSKTPKRTNKIIILDYDHAAANLTIC